MAPLTWAVAASVCPPGDGVELNAMKPWLEAMIRPLASASQDRPSPERVITLLKASGVSSLTSLRVPSPTGTTAAATGTLPLRLSWITPGVPGFTEARAASRSTSSGVSPERARISPSRSTR